MERYNTMVNSSEILDMVLFTMGTQITRTRCAKILCVIRTHRTPAYSIMGHWCVHGVDGFCLKILICLNKKNMFQKKIQMHVSDINDVISNLIQSVQIQNFRIFVSYPQTRPRLIIGTWKVSWNLSYGVLGCGHCNRIHNLHKSLHQ